MAGIVMDLQAKKLERVARRLKDWPEVAQSIFHQWLEEVEGTAQDLAPVRTGYLRDNIQSLGAKLAGDVVKGEILSAAEYSSYVHNGTSRMKGQPFLQDAVEEELSKLIRALQAGFNNLIKEG